MRRSEVHAAESVACLNRALHQLKDIWEEIGIPEDQRLQRTDVVKKHIKGLLDMMIAEEDSLRKRLMSSIESCRKELDVLCTELQLSPFEEDEGRTMLQLEKDIRSRLEVMMKQKSQRVKDLKTLYKQDRELCDIMCSVPFCIDMDSVPSLEQLDSYHSYLNDLTKEKDRRHGEFVGIKRQIIVCMEELDQLPDTSFERDVVCEDEEAFCLSSDNITALQLLLGQLQAECRRLEQLKVKNMSNVVEAIRAEVALLWERCFYSLEQRQAFTPYYGDDYTEEMLNLHQEELLSLKKHYEDHRELFEGVARWQDSWTLFLQLEKKATDPSRFNNRGGNLLKEEKQRAELQKSLPKLEKSLKTQIDLWEEEQYREFLVNGQRFLQYVQEQWELLRLEKEREKNERQLKKNQQIEQDMLYGTAQRTPSKRRLAETPTPGKARKLNATSSISSSTPNSTFRSAFGGTMCQSPVLRPPMSASKIPLRTPGRVGRTPHTVERNKENVSHLNGTALRTPASRCNITVNSVASTYSEFSRDLSKASKSKVKTGHLNSTGTRL
uniref:Protein regulator of cytokinesis 1 n=1 Tax=Oncorhynchus tshawytscha TaxID=74940 RepID=A0A8C8EG93_ONCTS